MDVFYAIKYAFRRGTLLSTAIFLYAITSPVNGYFGAALYSRYGGKSLIYFTAGNFHVQVFICFARVFLGKYFQYEHWPQSFYHSRSLKGNKSEDKSSCHAAIILRVGELHGVGGGDLASQHTKIITIP